MGQPQTAMPAQVQEHVVHDAPPPVPVVVPTITLPTDAVMASQQVLQPVTNAGQSKDLKNFMDLKPQEFDATQASIEPQKFIERYEKILSTLGLKETRGLEFATFLFSGSTESWWNSVQRDRRAGLPPITWSEFSAMFMDRFVPLSKRDDMRRQFEQLRQGTMTVIECEAKFIELATYAHFLVADEHEKVGRFVDGLEHRYRGPVVRYVQGGSYEEVVDTALRYESYQERDMAKRESKRARGAGGFS
ncbi:uncharacterized protein LOC142168920 [Nicotiana tabacum]|uniref:Uncharacterized protein LOC142168920 n=1 Tax=Nicotiana tabacum TaxID=4097 RepID=A0AC58SMJ1_TOBAC